MRKSFILIVIKVHFKAVAFSFKQSIPEEKQRWTSLCVSEHHVTITVAVKSGGKIGDIYLKVRGVKLPDSV